MTYQEVTPHLNKLVKVNLKNNKRKTGWLFFDTNKAIPQTPYQEVQCINIHYGRKWIDAEHVVEMDFLKPHTETFLVDEIRGIRSCK